MAVVERGREREEKRFPRSAKSLLLVAPTFLLSLRLDIQNNVADPEDHLLSRAASIVRAATLGEPTESIIWKIAQREAKAMETWDEQDPHFFPTQAPSERGPAITIAHMDELGNAEVLIAELTMLDKGAGKFVPHFSIRGLQQNETAFGAKAGTVREELLAAQTIRSRKEIGSLGTLDRASTPRELRRATLHFINIAETWYPVDVFGHVDFAVLTPKGVELSGIKRKCRSQSVGPL